MTALEYEELEQLARAATPGPWSDVRVGRQGTGAAASHEEQFCNAQGIAVAILTHDGSAEARANTRFISAASPDVVIGLIDALRRTTLIERARCVAAIDEARRAPAFYAKHGHGFDGDRVDDGMIDALEAIGVTWVDGVPLAAERTERERG